MKEITIGPLTLFGEHVGAHVHVTVRGAGQPGSRPLCGTFTITADEWIELAKPPSSIEFDGITWDADTIRWLLKQRRLEQDALLELKARLNASRKFFAEQADCADTIRREMSKIVVNALDRIMGDDGGN